MITYTLTGSEVSMQAFYVNPQSGLVSLKKPLEETVDTEFTVMLVFNSYVPIGYNTNPAADHNYCRF